MSPTTISTFTYTKDFFLAVMRGKIAGFSAQQKFGRNPSVDSGTDEDIWDAGGIYTYQDNAVALYASSTEAGDDQTLDYLGLDGSYNEFTVSKALNGQSQVRLGTTETFLRFFRGYVNDDNAPSGDIYIAEQDDLTGGVPDTASKIKGMIRAGFNQTYMSIYTIPAGYTGYIVQFYITLNKNQATGAADCTLFIREQGKVFRGRGTFGVSTTGTSALPIPLRLPIRVTEKSDIKIQADVSGSGNDITAGFDIVLIDNSIDI